MRSCALLLDIFATDLRETWMKMNKANVPVGFVRTIEQAFNTRAKCSATASANSALTASPV